MPAALVKDPMHMKHVLMYAADEATCIASMYSDLRVEVASRNFH